MTDIYSFQNSIEKYQAIESIPVIKGTINNPVISIFIPTYKRAETLKMTIESALQQQGESEYEIVIVNNDPNGIDNEVFDLLNSYHSEKIYYYVNKQNIGLCGNWNRGMELSRARYVTMIHDDDILSPYFLETMMKAIEENNYPGIIGVDYYSFSSRKLPVFEKPHGIKYRELTKRKFFFGNNINIAGMTVERSLFFNIGGYAEEYYPNEDTNFIYQMLLLDRVININYPLAGYRKEYNTSLTNDTMKNIILTTEATRRNIAEHESYAKRWMSCFDKEFLYTYIQGANSYWNLEIDFREIFKVLHMSEKKPNFFKLKLMGVLKKIEQKRG